jgi:hypothetical protein
MMSVTMAVRRGPVVQALFIGGPILLAGGLLAALIVRITMTTLQAPDAAMQLLPVGAYAGYSAPPASHHRLDNTLMVVFLCVAGLGLLGLAAAVVLRARRSLAVWLLVPGALMAIGGSIGGLVAKRSADLASFLDSQPKRLISNDPSNSLALNFDPSSAHYVAPDYTGFWVGMIVVAIGVLGVLAGVVAAIAKKRRAVFERP